MGGKESLDKPTMPRGKKKWSEPCCVAAVGAASDWRKVIPPRVLHADVGLCCSLFGWFSCEREKGNHPRVIFVRVSRFLKK